MTNTCRVAPEQLENLMKISSVVCSIALVLLAAETVQASDTYSQIEAERYIRKARLHGQRVLRTNDASVVKRILADDFVWVLDGEVLDKARAVSDAEKGPGDFLSNHLDYAHVRFFGDTAIAQGSET